MEKKKTVFVSGPITGVRNYWEAFEQAEDLLTGLGYIALIPSRLPQGMTTAQYMRICFAMIDSADAVLFLPGWDDSEGACAERAYCQSTQKPSAFLRARETFAGGKCPERVVRAWLAEDLEEVLKNAGND